MLSQRKEIDLLAAALTGGGIIQPHVTREPPQTLQLMREEGSRRVAAMSDLTAVKSQRTSASEHPATSPTSTDARAGGGSTAQLDLPATLAAAATTDRRRRWLQRSVSLDLASMTESQAWAESELMHQSHRTASAARSTRASLDQLLGRAPSSTAKPPPAAPAASSTRMAWPEYRTARSSGLGSLGLASSGIEQEFAVLEGRGSRMPVAAGRSGQSRTMQSAPSMGTDVVWTVRLPPVPQEQVQADYTDTSTDKERRRVRK